MRSSPLSFPSCWPLTPDTVWHTVSGVMKCSGWPVDLHTVLTQLRNIPLVVLALTLGGMNTYSYAWESFFLHIHQYQGFSTFFSSCWQHVASIVFLAGFSHFNPSSCERKEEKKKDGSVSEEAHSSWGSLITVTVERETEDERHERWSAADMAGISLQRWDESTYSAALTLLLISGCDITSSSRPSTEGSESATQQRPGQKGGEVNASRSDRQTHMDCALNYCQSSSSQRPLNISRRQLSYESRKCTDSSGKVSSSNPTLTCSSGGRSKSNNTTL